MTGATWDRGMAAAANQFYRSAVGPDIAGTRSRRAVNTRSGGVPRRWSCGGVRGSRVAGRAAPRRRDRMTRARKVERPPERGGRRWRDTGIRGCFMVWTHASPRGRPESHYSFRSGHGVKYGWVGYRNSIVPMRITSRNATGPGPAGWCFTTSVSRATEQAATVIAFSWPGFGDVVRCARGRNRSVYVPCCARAGVAVVPAALFCPARCRSLSRPAGCRFGVAVRGGAWWCSKRCATVGVSRRSPWC